MCMREGTDTLPFFPRRLLTELAASTFSSDHSRFADQRIFTPSLCGGDYDSRVSVEGRTFMADVLYLIGLVAFFALSAALVYGFERLRTPQ